MESSGGYNAGRAESAQSPGHELPGRIVLTIGIFISSWCLAGLILLPPGFGRQVSTPPMAMTALGS